MKPEKLVRSRQRMKDRAYTAEQEMRRLADTAIASVKRISARLILLEAAMNVLLRHKLMTEYEEEHAKLSNSQGQE